MDGQICNKTLVLLIFFSFLPFYPCLPHGTEVLKNHERSYLVDVRTLMVEQPCDGKNVPKDEGGSQERASLEVHHRLSPCFQQREADNVGKIEAPTFSQMLRQDRNRAIKMANLPINNGYPYDLSGQYLVKIGLGSRKQKVSVNFDTGRVLSWLQCSPCPNESCYAQKEPLFDTRKSKSYHSIECDTPPCKQLNDSHGAETTCSKDNQKVCRYRVEYEDLTSTTGNFSRDVLTLTKNDTFPSFMFGCSQRFNGVRSAAGILGLGRGGVNTSLLSQTTQKYNGLFSYCLPSSNCLSGHLTFGNGTSGQADYGSGSSQMTKFTPMIINPKHPSNYLVNLRGLSVGTQRLNLKPKVFSTEGTVIDSLTTYTYLPTKAFAALKSQVIKEMAMYDYPKVDRGIDDYVCYDLSNYTNVNIPKISLFFESYNKNKEREVEVLVDQTGVFLDFSGDASEVCLAFGDAGSGVSVFGNTQQKTYEVSYDTLGKKLGFWPKGCK